MTMERNDRIPRPDFVSSFDSALFSGLNLRCSIQQSFIRQIMSFVPTSSFFSSGNATTSRRSAASNRSSRPPSASASAVNAEPLREVSGSQLRNRENIIVSTREIRQLFDSIKELGDVVKRQNVKIERMAARLDDSCKELNDLKTALDRSMTAENQDPHRGSVPKQLKVCANS